MLVKWLQCTACNIMIIENNKRDGLVIEMRSNW